MAILSRRNTLVAFGAGGIALAGGWGLRHWFRSRSEEVDWARVFQEKQGEGLAEVRELTGSGTANDVPLEIGGMVPSGARMRLDPKSKAVLALPDRTIMSIRGKAELDLHLDRESGGIYRLLLGAVVSVVPKFNHYMAIGPTAVIGVKGTVFFREVFSANPEPGLTPDGMMPIPQGITDYACTCYGEVDYLRSPTAPKPFAAVSSHHHSAFFLRPVEGEVPQFDPAPMLNHFDDEIERLIELQDPPRHTRDWLQLDTSSRPEMPEIP